MLAYCAQKGVEASTLKGVQGHWVSAAPAPWSRSTMLAPIFAQRCRKPISARHTAGQVRSPSGLLRKMVELHQTGGLRLDRTLFGLADVRWPQDFGQGDKLVPLERETGRDGQSDTQAGVVQNGPFLGHTGVRRPPACEGRFRLEGCPVREVVGLPVLKPAEAEAVPDRAGSASADGRGRSSARAGSCPGARRAGCAGSGGGSGRTVAGPGTLRRDGGAG